MGTTLIVIIVIVTIILLIAKAQSNNDEKGVREYIESRNKPPKSILSSRNDGYFQIPQKLFPENPDINYYNVANEFDIYRNNVKYKYTFDTIKIKGLYYRHVKEIERAKNLRSNEELYLRKEENNPADPFAVRVLTWDGYFIGYIDTLYSLKVSRMIDECFILRCFLYHTSYTEIPYQTVIVISVKDKLQNTIIKVKPEIKITTPDYDKDKVIIIDYKNRIERLKENIRRSTKSAEKLLTEGKPHLSKKALERIAMYEEEIERLEKLNESIEKDKII